MPRLELAVIGFNLGVNLRQISFSGSSSQYLVVAPDSLLQRRQRSGRGTEGCMVQRPPSTERALSGIVSKTRGLERDVESAVYIRFFSSVLVSVL